MAEIDARKTIVLTGASRGIGHATVKRFSREGWRVITCSRQAFTADCPWPAGPDDHIKVDLADQVGVRRTDDQGSDERTDHLCRDVGRDLAPLESLERRERDRDGRVEVRPRDARRNVDAERHADAPGPGDRVVVACGSVAGDEYLHNMREARLASDGSAHWVETCFCSTPLEEERPYWEQYFELIRVKDAHARRNCRHENGTEPWACSDCDCTRKLEQRLESTGNPFLDSLRAHREK